MSSSPHENKVHYREVIKICNEVKISKFRLYSILKLNKCKSSKAGGWVGMAGGGGYCDKGGKGTLPNFHSNLTGMEGLCENQKMETKSTDKVKFANSVLMDMGFNGFFKWTKNS